MGVPLLRGRLFDGRDAGDSTRPRHHQPDAGDASTWPGEDPIGKRISVAGTTRVTDEIIGVVGDVRQAALETEARATIYWPYRRASLIRRMTVAVRTPR